MNKVGVVATSRVGWVGILCFILMGIASLPFIVSADGERKGGEEKARPKVEWVLAERNPFEPKAEYERRLDLFPGNMGCLSAIDAFLSGLSEVRPQYKRVAFPFVDEGRLCKDMTELERSILIKEKDALSNKTKPTNKTTGYSMELSTLHLKAITASDEKWFEGDDPPQGTKEAMKDRKGHFWAAKVRSSYMSLQSDIVETEWKFFLLYKSADAKSEWEVILHDRE